MNTVPLSQALRSLGYAAALEAELARIGPLTVEEFERHYACSPTRYYAPLVWDPTTARYWELFSRDPRELLRQRIAEELEALLPKEPGPSVPEETLDALFLLWNDFQSLHERYGEWEYQHWQEAWENVVHYTRAHPLLMVVALWVNWERQGLQALRGRRFETGHALLDWLELDAIVQIQQRKEAEASKEVPAVLRTFFGEGAGRTSHPEAPEQAGERRLHQLHRYLTGHYGIHTDFRLTEEETRLFRQNGVVVTQRLGARSFGDLYYHLFNNDVPVLVTIDSVLHAWHHSFDAILMELEEQGLMVLLEELLTSLIAQLPQAQQAYGQGLFAESLQDADLYLAVALSLLRGEATTTQFGQEPRVAETLRACSAQQMQEFALFGCERVVDFSQFKPRGHYEKSEALQRYFRAMMWLGRIDLRIAGGDDPAETTLQQLGAALLLLDLLRRADKFAAWQQFDCLLQTFVGVSDLLTFAQLDEVLQQSELSSLSAISQWTELERLQEALLASEAGFQQIASDFFLSDPDRPEPVSLPRSFTMLGQKFTLDSWALGQVVCDRVLWNEEKVMRRVPSCLDVAFAVLGNDQVVPELAARIRDTNGRMYRDGLPYQHNLAAVHNVIEAQNELVWQASLYTQWLHCLRALSAPLTGPEYPQALRTSVWAAKALNTQLASWTQLRHDTILYVKQSYTMTLACSYPAGYVEPNPLFWSRMEKMATHAADLLAQTPFPPLSPMGSNSSAVQRSAPSRQHKESEEEFSEGLASQRIQQKQIAFLRQFAETVGILRGIAEKQSAQRELNETDTTFLQNIVQIVDTFGSGGGRDYNGWYPGLFYAGPEKCAEGDALVADVHTNTPSDWPPDPGCVLHQGVGGVDLLLIAIENGEERVIFAGPTLSHYEFEMPGVSRKADSEWKTDLASGRFPARPSWTQSYLVPADQIPSLPIVPGVKDRMLRSLPSADKE